MDRDSRRYVVQSTQLIIMMSLSGERDISKAWVSDQLLTKISHDRQTTFSLI